MDNFSSPDHVSPTLESDELARLKHSLRMTVPEETAEKIMSELPLANPSTPAERAEWVENMSALLENTFDEETVKAIRGNCHCNENGRLEETTGVLKELHISVGRDLNRFVQAVNERGAAWYIEDERLFTQMLT